MMSVSMTEEIAVRHPADKEPMVFQLENGVLRLSALKAYFPFALGLKYHKNGLCYCVTLEEDFLKIPPDVCIFDVFLAEDGSKRDGTMSEKKKLQFQEILSCIKNEGTKDIKEEKKKVGARPKIGKKKVDKSIHIGWKHRNSLDENFKQMQTPVGGIKLLTLDCSETYTVEQVKNLSIKLFQTELTKSYFTNSLIQIGKYDNIIIPEFATKDGDEDLWRYASDMCDKASRLKLYLLTTYISSTSTDSENIFAKAQEKSEVGSSSLRHPNPTRNWSLQDITNVRDVLARAESSTSIKRKADFTSDEKSRKEFLSEEKRLEKTSTHHPQKDFASNKLQMEAEKFIFRLPPQKSETKEPGWRTSLKKIAAASVTESIASPSYSKLTFYETGDKNARKSLHDINSLHIPVITIIPISDLLFSETELGRGTFGTVCKGTWSATTVAIKSMDMISSSYKDIFKEVAILKQLSHENIIQIMGVCCEDTQFHIVMEFIDGHNLKDILFKENVKRKLNLDLEKKNDIGLQICKAMAFIHFHPSQVLHRDLKPANILVSYKLQVKICDLGLAKMKQITSQLLTTQGKKTCPGTPLYMAPELLLYKEKATIFSDMWSLGCTLVELYKSAFVWKLQEGNAYAELRSLLQKGIKPDVNKAPLFMQDTLMQCFNYEPKKRPYATVILSIYRQYEKTASF